MNGPFEMRLLFDQGQTVSRTHNCQHYQLFQTLAQSDKARGGATKQQGSLGALVLHAQLAQATKA